jgi:uncharacterized protein (DUF2147 family)
MRRYSIALFAFLAANPALASPAGLWQTIDDETDEVTGVVRIEERDGLLFGNIVEVLDPEAKPGAVCTLCTDERKDQPLVGLTIIRNVVADDSPGGPWSGGDILDPEDGKVYKVRLELADAGRKLEVRGYIGAPLLGRTQVWRRVE